MFTKVKDYIQKRILISDEDLEKAFQYSSLRNYKKHDYILRPGEYCRFIGFLKVLSSLLSLMNRAKRQPVVFALKIVFSPIVRGSLLMNLRIKIILKYKIAKC